MENSKKELPKVITVTGEENTGKTTLIKFVYDVLRQSGAIVLLYEQTGAYFEDFHAVLVWNCKIIAICSIGDEADKEEKDLWKYIKDGIDLAINYNADFLINTLSIPIPYDNYDKIKNNKEKEKHKQETKDGYEKILKQKLSTDEYEAINLEYITPGDYKPLQERRIKCREILEIIGITISSIYPICKQSFCDCNLWKKDCFCLDQNEKRKHKLYFPNVAVIILAIITAISCTITFLMNLFEVSEIVQICSIVCSSIVMGGIIASIIVSLCKQNRKRKTEVKTKLLFNMFKDSEQFLSCPYNNMNANSLTTYKDVVKSITNAMADI